MKRAIALVILAGLLVTCSEARAAKVAVEWDNPVANTDGTALTNLASVTVVWGPCSDSGAVASVQAAEKVITTVPGAHVTAFAYPTALAKACLAAYATNTNGQSGPWTAAVEWTAPATLGQPGAIAGVIHLNWSSHHAKS